MLSTLPAHIANKIQIASSTGCWLWTGMLVAGHGQLWQGDHRIQAYRAVWQILRGPITAQHGLAHHSCEDKRCVNPDHIEWSHTVKHSIRSILNTDLQKLLKWVVPVTESGCWLWTRFCNQQGYSQVHDRQVKKHYVHRLFYQHYKGIIPSGFVLDHLCRVRCCVNPDHLEVVTIGENTLRGESISSKHRAKTHCEHGHPLVPGNLAHLSTRPRTRICLICKRNSSRRFKQNRRTQMDLNRSGQGVEG